VTMVTGDPGDGIRISAEGHQHRGVAHDIG
jgi:hypothetical protein